MPFASSFPAGRRIATKRIGLVVAAAVLIAGPALFLVGTASGQQAGVDCERLRRQIAQADRGGRSAGQTRRQMAEIARTQAMAHRLGCDQFTFFGGNPQCGGINTRLQQLQAGLAQLQAGGGGGHGDLAQRYEVYCRGGQPQPAQPRGFFESLFGGTEERREPLPQLPPEQTKEAEEDDGYGAHGGSQAVCVRTCDGGFFPLGISPRRGKESLTEMCQALCPGTETAVFTRNPDSDIKTAVDLDGKPYMEMPNALKYQKAVTPACGCRQAGKSWAETLANAEEVLGNTRKGDIVVTKEKSDELSRPKLDPRKTSAMLSQGQTTERPARVGPDDAAKIAGDSATGDPTSTPETDGIRRVGPSP